MSTTLKNNDVANAGKKRIISIDIVSDTVWPWCFVGKRRVEAAIKLAKTNPDFGEVEFDVRWRPFQLRPNTPKGKGINKIDMYLQNFGQAWFESMVSRMKLIGDSEGIKFSYGGSTANTFDSHRLIWKAREEGGSMLQNKLVEILFKAYFEEEKCIGEQSVLMNCAEKAGMDATEMFQNTDIGKKETLNEVKHFRQAYGVTGVPFLVFDEKYTSSGAQSADDIMTMFEKLL